MEKINTIKLIPFLFVLILFTSLTFHPQALSQNFKLSTDCLDSFGGRASSDNFSERVGSGGQPGIIGTSQGTSFYGLQGYVHTAAFEHGDANANGGVTISDVVYIVNYLFKDGPKPVPLETGDVNGNNECTIADAVYLVNYLFKDGNPPINL